MTPQREYRVASKFGLVTVHGPGDAMRQFDEDVAARILLGHGQPDQLCGTCNGIGNIDDGDGTGEYRQCPDCLGDGGESKCANCGGNLLPHMVDSVCDACHWEDHDV